jgi:plastocyanin
MRPCLVAAVAAALAGCGGSPSLEPVRDTTAQAATPATSPPPRATARIVDFVYRPRTLRVRAGTHVTWRNLDTTNHTITFTGGGPAAIGNLRPRSRATRAFPRAGRFTYVCVFHPSMRGTIVVG